MLRRRDWKTLCTERRSATKRGSPNILGRKILSVAYSKTQEKNTREANEQRQVDADAIRAALSRWATWTSKDGTHWTVTFSTGTDATIDPNDLRQYGSVAYSLRAVLAVQQEALYANTDLPKLTSEAVDTLKEGLDLISLAVLRLADRDARQNNAYEISLPVLESTWQRLIPSEPQPPSDVSPTSPSMRTGLMHQIIQQKVTAYQAYNKISNQLFGRNMQVFFARLSWPTDPEEAKAFKNEFINTVTGFAVGLYTLADREARRNGHVVLREEDVATAAQTYLPHAINDYEDVVFFPRLTRDQQIAIESYDMDAFRDSGVHWKYLEFALEEKALEATREADPFALELLTENIAHFGVLLLRVAGAEGAGQERLSPDLLTLATTRLQAKIDAHERTPKSRLDAPPILSAVGGKATHSSGEHTMFEDHTEAAGIEYVHRSSDWLNRLLRSYLQKTDTTGTITVPPAFGGSGVAAEDIDQDGQVDILLLGGRGNRLYRNLGNGMFEDITASAGIDYRRQGDKQPGEPRQPLIADFDNDGLPDILITYVNDDHRLYRGLGKGRFEDVTVTAQLGGRGLVGGPATTFDYDKDGLLDVYITYFGNYLRGVLPTLQRRNRNGLPNRLFRNLGNMRFEDVTESAGVADIGWGQAVLHTDLDGNGWQDLIVGNDFGLNAYYLNRGDGTFQEVSKEIGTDKPSYTMSISATDLNRDLLPDIYISNIVVMNKDEKYVLPNENTQMKFDIKKLAHLQVMEANDLFMSSRLDNAPIHYTLSQDVGRGYSSTGWAWDADFFDADHDGDDDLYVLNGMNEFNVYSSKNPYFMDADDLENRQAFLPVSTEEANVFFLNRGGKLENHSKQSGLDLLGNSRSAAYFDLEGDGDLDIVLLNYHGPATLYRNNLDQPDRHWIKLKLVGDPNQRVNRDAIGAVVVFELPDGTMIRREIHGSTGYMSVHPKTVHAGIGNATSVDVQIVWPNGQTQSLDGLVADQVHRLVQPSSQSMSDS